MPSSPGLAAGVFSKRDLGLGEVRAPRGAMVCGEFPRESQSWECTPSGRMSQSRQDVIEGIGVETADGIGQVDRVIR